MDQVFQVLRWLFASTSLGISRATLIVLAAGLAITMLMLLISKVPRRVQLEQPAGPCGRTRD